MRNTPAEWSPSKWSIISAWEGILSDTPERELVQIARVSAASISNEANRALAPNSPAFEASVPGARILMPENREGVGWTKIQFDTPVALDIAEQEAWKIAHLEALLSGSKVGVPQMEFCLASGATVKRMDKRDGICKILVVHADFQNGLAAGIEAWWRVCETMPLVVERWITAMDPQPLLSKAQLIVTTFQPLFDVLYPRERTPVSEWDTRRTRILDLVAPEDRGFVASKLPEDPPPPSQRDKAQTLLQRGASAMQLTPEQVTQLAGNIEDIRTELVHRTRPRYKTVARYRELQEVANAGISLVMFHLLLRIGVSTAAAEKVLQAHWSNWVTWTLPSSVEETLGDRRQRDT